SPFPDGGLNEALGLAVGFGRIGLSADVLDAEVPASVSEGESFVAAAIIGHDAAHRDAKAFVISHSRLEKGNGAVCILIRLDLGDSYAGVIVDADMDEIPAGDAAGG